MTVGTARASRAANVTDARTCHGRGLTLLFLVAALTLGTGGALADDRAVVFGDSLTDNGNYFAVTGFPPPPSYKGRASNGLVWPEFLFGPLNSPVQSTGVNGNVDMAYFGARSDDVDNPILYPTRIPGAKGLPLQIADFVAAGGRIHANDTVVVWAGANNIRECIDGPTTCLTRATLRQNASAAAISQVAAVNRLIQLGARTVLVPSTTIGPLPYWPGAAEQEAAAFSRDAFNATLFSNLKQLAGSALRGTNVIYADVVAANNVIFNSPSAFGFSNTTQPCFDGVTVCSDPDAYFLWDVIHPSAAVHSLYALYFSLLLDTTPALLDTAPLGDSLYESGALVTDAVYDRLANWFSGTYAGKNGPYMEALGQLSRIDRDGNRPGFDIDSGGMRFGLDKEFNIGLAGVSIALLRGPLDSANLSSDTQTVRGDVYGLYEHGPFYVSANAGFGGTWFDDVERHTGFGPVVASSDSEGYFATASAELGVARTLGGVIFVPSARLTYAHAHLNGYKEQADLLALEFEDRDSDALLGRVSLRAVKNYEMWGAATALFAEVGYEGFLSFSGNEITAVLANNTALPATVSPADPGVPGILAKVGGSARLAENLYFDLNYGVSILDDGGETHAGNARLKAHF